MKQNHVRFDLPGRILRMVDCREWQQLSEVGNVCQRTNVIEKNFCQRKLVFAHNIVACRKINRNSRGKCHWENILPKKTCVFNNVYTSLSVGCVEINLNSRNKCHSGTKFCHRKLLFKKNVKCTHLLYLDMKIDLHWKTSVIRGKPLLLPKYNFLKTFNCGEIHI